MKNPDKLPEKPPEQEAKGLELIEATGLAKDLLEKNETFKPYSSWMGIGTNEKMYPDEMVKNYIRWSSKRSEKFLLVIADDIQIYNLIPFSNKGWDKMKEVGDFRKLAEERKKMMQIWLGAEGISNVDVRGWMEIIDELRMKNPDFNCVDYNNQLFDHTRQHNPDLDQAITKIAPKQIPRLFLKMQKEGKGGEELRFGKFVASLYGQNEIFLTWLLAKYGGYPIKVGHEGERVYDELTADILNGKYGTQLADPDIRVGSVYLKKIISEDRKE